VTATVKTAAVALVAVTIVWLAQPGTVSGHALILESVPRPDEALPPSPSRIVLRFNGLIERSLSRVAITNSNGGRLPLHPAAEGPPGHLILPVPALTPGSYTLEWRVLSADGHVTRGSFPFRVAPAP